MKFVLILIAMSTDAGVSIHKAGDTLFNNQSQCKIAATVTELRLAKEGVQDARIECVAQSEVDGFKFNETRVTFQPVYPPAPNAK